MPQPILEKLVQDIGNLRTRLEVLETQEGVTLLTDYSSTSTIVGWSAYDSGYPDIFYTTHGNLVIVWFRIEGTSNATGTSFTLPFANSASVASIGTCRIRDNGTFAFGIMTLAASASIVNLYPTAAGGSWTNSGSKWIQGMIAYHR